MSISDWTLDQIETLIQRYRQRGLTEGGKFPLSELLLEQKRRTPSRFSGAEVVRAILLLARSSHSCFVTYGELHSHLTGGLPWKGNATQRDMGNALERGIAYCVESGLPLLTVLVVRASGNLSADAVRRIYEEAKELGVDVGFSADEFVQKQISLSTAFVRQGADHSVTAPSI